MATREEIYAAIKNADAAGDGDSVRKLGAYLQTMDAPAPAETPAPDTYGSRLKANTVALGREARDVGLGAIRGAGSIGNTILSINSLGQLGSRADRAEGMDATLRDMGADTNSAGFKGGKLGLEVAGTAGAGSAIGAAAKGLGAAPEVVNALRTGGFTTGPSRLSAAGNLALRSGAGAAAGGATVGIADPEHAGLGAAIGGALPGVSLVAGKAANALGGVAQDAAKGLMGSALKGTIKMHAKGDVDTAVQTLLDYGINPTAGGVEKIKGLVSDLNDKIATAIEGSTAKIDKQKVLNALSRSRETFGTQVAPTNDLAAIEGIGADFTQSHPDQIPVQLAQKLKQGTDRVLKGKFGEQGSASTEAQKDLRYGLKTGIAEAVPEVAPLNAAESRLLTTLKVAERRAMMDVNKNPVALDAGLALATGHPFAAVGLLANSRAYTKAMAARGLNALSQGSPDLNALAGPAVYRSLPRAGQRN